MRNVFTVDLEDWFHANYSGLTGPSDRRPSGHLRRQVDELLWMLRTASARATFFVLGEVAEADGRLAQTVVQAGHEVACHGYDHKLVSEMSCEAFKADLVRSVKALERAGTPRVRGYRAPSWSLEQSRVDLFEALAELGFTYDASLFPFRTFLYGDDRAPRRAFRTHAGLVEYPSSAIEVAGRRVSFFGGFYLRAAPYAAIAWGIRRLNREGLPAIIYIHPREIDPTHPRLRLRPRDRLVHYLNVSGTRAKLRRLFREFEFGAFADSPIVA
ncbi:MAG: polysaccharide deacetylase family protein [Chloroflexi bacterium]|nr:polysaccharide deacetylase family protein [Chloroflexota bacterium]